jgi:hypothetical protein
VVFLAMTACHSSTGTTPAGATRVLFIGNSLTSVNDLPHMFASVAAAGGFDVTTRAVTVDNANLDDHFFLGEAPAEIRDGDWDYVVMQQGPSGRPDSRIQLVSATRRFATLIEAEGGTPALYMVWPDGSRRTAFDSVSASYTAAADAVSGLLFPAGDAWVRAWEERPSLRFYGGDDFHPSSLGSYLAALTIYAVLCDRSPAALPLRPVGINAILLRGTPDADVRLMHEAAADVTADLPRKGQCAPHAP